MKITYRTVNIPINGLGDYRYQIALAHPVKYMKITVGFVFTESTQAAATFFTISEQEIVPAGASPILTCTGEVTATLAGNFIYTKNMADSQFYYFPYARELQNSGRITVAAQNVNAVPVGNILIRFEFMDDYPESDERSKKYRS